VIHSLVTYIDGSVLAQLGSPDMRTPIAYALAWPQRMPAPSARLDLAQIASLTFEAPDVIRFPAMALARQALKDGGGAPTVLNAANEVAVAGFLAGRLAFLDIARVVEETLAGVPQCQLVSFDQVHELDRQAREEAGRRMTALN
jgi:1-deoxy-D-xylulose-5-phosphate reductoisomerase